MNWFTVFGLVFVMVVMLVMVRLMSIQKIFSGGLRGEYYTAIVPHVWLFFAILWKRAQQRVLNHLRVGIHGAAQRRDTVAKIA